jgi:hypothetical protein
MHEIPLGKAEQAAVKEGVTAYERLLAKLAMSRHRPGKLRDRSMKNQVAGFSNLLTLNAKSY